MAMAVLVVGSWATAEVQLPSESATWYELRSPHFVVVSNTRAGRVTELTVELERMVEAVGSVIRQPKTNREPTLVVLLSPTGVFNDYCSSVLRRSCEGLGGWFLTSHLGSAILANAVDYDRARTTVCHELTHKLLFQTSPSLPLWLQEGLAEFYGTFMLYGDYVRIGQPILGHLATIARYGVPKLDRLLATSPDSPEYVGEEGRGPFYAGAWLLTHYLMIGSPQRHGQLARYIAAIDRGEAADAAFWAVTGAKAEGLEKELWAYTQESRMPALRVNTGELAPIVLAQPRRLAYDEVLLHLAKPLTRTKANDLDAVALVERARTANPKSAAAAALRAWMLAQEGRIDESSALFEVAITLDPGLARTYCLFADVLLEHTASAGGGPAGVAALTRARSLLDRALELDPDSVDALVALGRTYVMTPVEDCGIGIARLSRALALAPDRSEAAFYLAQLHMRAGFPGRAETVIARHIANSPDPLVRARAANLRVDAAVANARRLVADGKSDEACRVLERAVANTANPGLQDYVQLELTRSRAAARIDALRDRIKSASPAAALAACDEELATITDPLLRKEVEGIRSVIQSGPEGSRVASSPAATDAHKTPGTNNPVPSRRHQWSTDIMTNDEQEAARYNKAAALYNQHEYAAALQIVDDLAAKAGNPYPAPLLLQATHKT